MLKYGSFSRKRIFEFHDLLFKAGIEGIR
jgi:hypothetical protein